MNPGVNPGALPGGASGGAVGSGGVLLKEPRGLEAGDVEAMPVVVEPAAVPRSASTSAPAAPPRGRGSSCSERIAALTSARRAAANHAGHSAAASRAAWAWMRAARGSLMGGSRKPPGRPGSRSRCSPWSIAQWLSRITRTRSAGTKSPSLRRMPGQVVDASSHACRDERFLRPEGPRAALLRPNGVDPAARRAVLVPSQEHAVVPAVALDLVEGPLPVLAAGEALAELADAHAEVVGDGAGLGLGVPDVARGAGAAVAALGAREAEAGLEPGRSGTHRGQASRRL